MIQRLIALVIVSVLVPTQVFAVSQEQKDVFDAGAEYFNIEEDTCGSVDSPIPLGGNSIYIMGDSLTVGMSNEANIDPTETLKGQLGANGWSPVVNGQGCRPLWYGGSTTQEVTATPECGQPAGGFITSGFRQLEIDRPVISTSKAFVISLGTNRTESNDAEFEQKASEFADALLREAPGLAGNIYWVNLFATSYNFDARNAIIARVAAAKNVQVIDFAAAARAEPARYVFGADGIHMTPEGYKNKATLIANAIGQGSGSTSNSGTLSNASYDPLSLSFPRFPNESTIATNLTNYIQEHAPRSPWLSVDSNMGQWLLTESKQRDINPLLIAAVGKQENQFGTVGGKHVTEYYNYFGMKGTVPIDIPGSEYRGFSSPAEGLRFFMDKVKTNIQGPDRGLYAEVVNFYDYLGMHQAGIIKYPGEPLGDQGPTGQDGYDSAMRVYISWTTSDHPNNEYDGQLFNPGIYYANSVGFINKITGLTISDIPVKGGSGYIANCVGGTPGGSGRVDPSGYAFPLAPQTRAVGGIEVGQTLTKHHDDTAAYDLFSTDSAAVYAITDGVATKIEKDYHGIAGCSTIQFLGKDGLYYWYGHLKNVTIQEQQPVSAGQQIAQIADDQNFGSECWGGGPHLHIDRGCILEGIPQTGGRDECRDPDFIPFLSKLYEGLPNS